MVTGASSGIGEATALSLANEGASVDLIARREDRLKALEKKISDTTMAKTISVIVLTELTDHISDSTVKDSVKGWVASMTALSSEDIANAIVYAVTQPPHVNVNEILIRPTDQTF